MSVTDTDVEGVTHAIWQALFGLPLTCGRSQSLPSEPAVTGLVHIDGAWTGALVVKCPLDLAQQLTAIMFGAGETSVAGDPSEDDVRDAIGEVANMLAGNVKALIVEPCSISLPAVAFGSGVHVSVPRSELQASAAFLCGGRPLEVTLLRRTTTGPL